MDCDQVLLKGEIREVRCFLCGSGEVAQSSAQQPTNIMRQYQYSQIEAAGEVSQAMYNAQTRRQAEIVGPAGN